MTINPPPYLTPVQAGRLIGVRPETIRAWIAAGHLPAVRTPGGLYRIAQEDLLLALRPGRGGDAEGGAR